MKRLLDTVQHKFFSCCILLVAILGGILLLSQYITPVYVVNDDMMIRSILSGTYTGMPDGHAIYMQYPLSGLLSVLYTLTDLPWYELMSLGLIVFSMFVITYDSRNRVISFLLCVILVYPLYFNMHYTTTAALLAATAVLVVYRGRRLYLFPILWLLAYMLRKEVGMLCIPFLVLAFGVYIMWRENDLKRSWKQFFCAVGIAGVGFITCLLINNLCYSSDEWKDFRKFNKYRVSLYDYTDFIPSDYYKDHCDEFGLTPEQHHIMTTYNILLDEWLDTELLEQLSESVISHMERSQNYVQDIVKAIKIRFSQVYYDAYPYNLLCCVGYFLIGVYIVQKRCWKQLIPLAGVGIGIELIAVFLILQGRFPERVAISLYLIEIMSLLGVAQCLDREWHVGCKTLTWIITLGSVLFLSVVGGTVLKNLWIQNQTMLVYQKSWDQIKSYCEEQPDQIYWGYTFSMQAYPGMPYENMATNLYMLGSWTANSPLIHAIYEELQVMDAAESLVMNENAHLLIEDFRDIALLKSYFDNRFGDVEFEVVSHINLENGNMLIDYQLKQVENL